MKPELQLIVMSTAYTDNIKTNNSKENTATIICDILNHPKENFIIEIKPISWSCPDLIFFKNEYPNPDPKKSQVSCSISNPDPVHAHLW